MNEEMDRIYEAFRSSDNDDEEAKALLEAQGFKEPESFFRTMRALREKLLPSPLDRSLFNSIMTSLSDSFDPEAALKSFEVWVKATPRDFIHSLLTKGDPMTMPALSAILSSSPYLTGVLLREPAYASLTFTAEGLRAPKDKAALQKELAGLLADAADFDEKLEALRSFKHREYLRTAVRDLLRVDRPEAILEELSTVADVCLQGALGFCREDLEKRHGTPHYTTPDGEEQECRFAIIGLGKLGGNELNFSSDIDILYVYTSDDGETAGIGGKNGQAENRISNHEFFTKLSMMITDAISRVTGNGSAFRVDLRLRPEGDKGDICYSLRSYEIYYESWGQTWERQALIKARPVAGDPELALAFLQMIKPFIYRKYLDYSSLEEIKSIKERINRALLGTKTDQDNVKLGFGGIREIEFIIQSFQLIYGGSDRQLQEHNNLTALRKLGEKGYIPQKDADDLAEAYTFLRELENRIQMVRGVQTHLIPGSVEERAALARKIGVRGKTPQWLANQLMSQYHHHTSRVREIYDALFYEKDDSEEEKGEAIDLEEENSQLFSKELQQRGFSDPDRVLNALLSLRNGPQFSHQTPRAKQLADKLIPAMINLSSKSPDPSRALINLEKFVSAYGARETFFELLQEEPKLLEVLLSIFAGSQFVADILVRDPKLVDVVMDPLAMTMIKPRDHMERELREALAGCTSYEGKLDGLRRFKMAEELRMCARDILKEADLVETMKDLTTLADVLVDAASGLVYEEVRSRYGTPIIGRAGDGGRECGYLIVGMGKYGGSEMNYASDLDIIFLYSGDGETHGEGRIREGISNYHFFTRFYEGFVHSMSGMTGAGYAYKVDARLRPEGKMGSPALSLDRFRKYHQERADAWERLALVKARVATGDPDLGAEFTAAVHHFAYEKPFDRRMVDEIEHIRHRMERELAQEHRGGRNVKLGYGAIVDVEFLTQLLQLRYGGTEPRLRVPGTLEALDRLRDCGILESDDHKALVDSYIFLRELENKIRIVHEKPSDTLPASREELTSLARRLGYISTPGLGAGESLMKDYKAHTRRVRDIFNKVFARERELAR